MILALSSTEPVKQRTDEYYSAICAGDLPRAYALTTGKLREAGFEAFAARYSQSIDVTEVVVTPSSAVTTLRLTRPDGTVENQRRELRFTAGDHLIKSDEQVF